MTGSGGTRGYKWGCISAKWGYIPLSTPSRYPAQGCVKLGAHKTGCSNSPTPYNITPYRTPRNSATPGLELPALRACGEDPKGGGVHSPFTIHHSPFTIHHSPFTIHHSPFTIHHSPFTLFIQATLVRQWGSNYPYPDGPGGTRYPPGARQHPQGVTHFLPGTPGTN